MLFHDFLWTTWTQLDTTKSKWTKFEDIQIKTSLELMFKRGQDKKTSENRKINNEQEERIISLISRRKDISLRYDAPEDSIGFWRKRRAIIGPHKIKGLHLRPISLELSLRNRGNCTCNQGECGSEIVFPCENRKISFLELLSFNGSVWGNIEGYEIF